MKRRTFRSSRGFTLIEGVVAVTLSVAVLGMVGGLATSSLKMSRSTESSEDASRALLLGVETIRADLSRARIDHQNPDLSVGPAEATLTFRVLTGPISNWQAPTRRVSYALSKSGTLVRTADDGSRRELKGCLFSGLKFAWAAPQRTTPWKSTVTVVLETPSGTRDARDTRQLVARIPVMLDKPPPAYPWQPQVKS